MFLNDHQNKHLEIINEENVLNNEQRPFSLHQNEIHLEMEIVHVVQVLTDQTNDFETNHCIPLYQVLAQKESPFRLHCLRELHNQQIQQTQVFFS